MQFRPVTKAMFKEVTEERYDEMLGVLPPAIMTGYGFLVGEASDHRMCSVEQEVMPRFAAFVQKGSKFFEAKQPMTVKEFKAVNLSELA